MDDTKPVQPDNAHQTTPPADTLPEWLCERFGRYQPGMTPWVELGDGDRVYWAHQADAVRRAVVRGGFRIDPTEQLPDGTTLSWEQRALKAEYTIERMKRTNRMVNGGARDSRERAQQLADDARFLLEWLDEPEPKHAHLRPGCWDADGSPCDRCTRVAQIRTRLEG